MKSEMAKKLKEILAKTSQEEFDKEWEEIEAMKLEGPGAEQVLEYLTANLQITIEYEFTFSEFADNSFDKPTYSTAA